MNRFGVIATVAGVVSLPVVYTMFRRYIAGGVCTSEARMDGKTVLITGANAGIGKETAIDLAKRGARVIMACRDMKRGEDALNDVAEKSGSSNLVLKQLDLASLASVRTLAEDVNKTEPALHVLINNAGVMIPPELQKTQDGFEIQMGVNHFGHFLLTNLLLDLLKSSQPSRIVVVSSMAHSMTSSSFNFDNINCEKFYRKWDAYGQSKLANILFTRELAKRLGGTDVTVNSLHPGAVKTELSRNTGTIESIAFQFMFLFFKTPKEGAQTSIYLAVSEEVEGVTGLYFTDCKVKEPSQAAQDDEAAKKLWDVSAKAVGLE
ncbi:retinol dehydrogenase 11-like [Dendronephthya gigantea]|uniref:retinol dehydrogenase 11-like n=1 Tax=Dendronephthya gigantea TaxID=151771 RepID=UPI00106A11AB|nr:retinol dehydrogenase 11-like [Dendronephthya gigantea]